MGSDNLLLGALVAVGGYLVMKSINEAPVAVSNTGGGTVPGGTNVVPVNTGGATPIQNGGGSPVVTPVDMSTPMIVDLTVDAHGFTVTWSGPVTDVRIKTDNSDTTVPISELPGGRLDQDWPASETFICISAIQNGVENTVSDDVQCRSLTGLTIQTPVTQQPVITPAVTVTAIQTLQDKFGNTYVLYSDQTMTMNGHGGYTTKDYMQLTSDGFIQVHDTDRPTMIDEFDGSQWQTIPLGGSLMSSPVTTQPVIPTSVLPVSLVGSGDPTVPNNVAVTGVNGAWVLSWSPPGNGPVTGYDVALFDRSAVPFIFIAGSHVDQNTLSVNFNNVLTAGVPYGWYVGAYINGVKQDNESKVVIQI